MRDAMQAALADLESHVGNLDEFVAGKLGYTVAEAVGTKNRPGYFSAEQIDALALSIANVEDGAGFIIGDQTGIGKGRVVAGMLRYALHHGLEPVFVTQNPALYADMVRDWGDAVAFLAVA